MAKTIDTGKGLETLANLNQRTIETAVKLHDAGGLSWGQIGQQVGMTAQAASRRFGQTSTGRITGGGGRGGGRGRG